MIARTGPDVGPRVWEDYILGLIQNVLIGAIVHYNGVCSRESATMTSEQLVQILKEQVLISARHFEGGHPAVPIPTLEGLARDLAKYKGRELDAAEQILHYRVSGRLLHGAPDSNVRDHGELTEERVAE